VSKVGLLLVHLAWGREALGAKGDKVSNYKSRRGKHLCAIAVQMSAATAFSKLRNRFPRRERGRVGAG